MKLDPSLAQVIVGVFAFLGTLLGGGVIGRLIFFRYERDGKIVGNAVVLVDQLQEEVARMRLERLEDRKDIEDLREENDQLRLEIRALLEMPPRCSSCPLWSEHAGRFGPEAGKPGCG